MEIMGCVRVLSMCRNYLPSLGAAEKLWDDLTGDDVRLGKLIDTWVEMYKIAYPASINFVQNHLQTTLVDVDVGRAYFASCKNKKDINETGGDLFYQLAANGKYLPNMPTILITADTLPAFGDLLQIGVRRIPNFDDTIDCAAVAKLAVAMFPDVVKSGGGHNFAAAYQVPKDTSLEVICSISADVSVAYLQSL